MSVWRSNSQARNFMMRDSAGNSSIGTYQNITSNDAKSRARIERWREAGDGGICRNCLSKEFKREKEDKRTSIRCLLSSLVLQFSQWLAFSQRPRTIGKRMRTKRTDTTFCRHCFTCHNAFHRILNCSLMITLWVDVREYKNLSESSAKLRCEIDGSGNRVRNIDVLSLSSFMVSSLSSMAIAATINYSLSLTVSTHWTSLICW